MPVPFEILANHKQSSELNLSTPVIKWKDYHLPSLTRNPMHHRTTACFLILLLLCCGLKCNTDVARVVLPEITDTSETTPLFEMEAILATRGEVHSPIPDAVYDALWGHWTEVGLSTPRDYYTKYIDAGGIAIVGGDLVHDKIFQVARHIVLVMTSKVPGLRDILSYNQPGGISGDEIPFRLVLTEHFSADFVNMPEYHNADNLRHLQGTFDGNIARADVYIIPDDWWNGKHKGENRVGYPHTIIHEMVHAIEAALFYHNLVPTFNERLEAAFAREMDKVRLYEEAHAAGANINELVATGDLPIYCNQTGSHGHLNASEFWAMFVQKKWMRAIWHPGIRAFSTGEEEFFLNECPLLFGITQEVFPAFPLRLAIERTDYK